MANNDAYANLTDEELNQKVLSLSQKKSSVTPYEDMSDDDLNAKVLELQGAAHQQVDRPLEAGFAGAKQGLLMGYAPQVEAGISRGIEKVGGLLGMGPEAEDEKLRAQGFKVPERSYISERDRIADEYRGLEESNPKSYMAGNLGGALATVPLMGGAGAATKAGSFLGNMAKATGAGAAYGALQNPGDIKGEIAGLQLEDRLEGAKQGAKFGAGAMVGSAVASKGLQKLANSSKAMKEFSNALALKSSGAMLKDYRRIYGRGREDDIAETMFKEGLVVPGQSVDDVANAVKPVKESVGSQIGNIYKSVDDVSKISIDPAALKQKLMGAIRGKAPRLEKKEYLESMEKYIDDIVSNPDNLVDVRNMNDLIGDIDQKISYQKRIQDLPEKQAGLFEIRRELRNSVNDLVDNFGKMSGDRELAKKLRDLNKRYSNLSEIDAIASDRALRDASNRMISLTDTIAGGAGAVTGAAAGGGDLKSGAVGALGMGVLNHMARRYGTQPAALAAREGAKVLAPISGGARIANKGLLGASPKAIGVLGAAESRDQKEKKK